jgi:hypothetical protein
VVQAVQKQNKRTIMNIKSFIFHIFLIPQFSWAININLDPALWHKVEYPKIKTNTIEQVKNGLQVFVKSSSSALVYKFDKPIFIKDVRIKAILNGKIDYGQEIPGSKKADDFPLRLGFILKGKNKLNFFQRTIAPNWLNEIDNISSKAGGLDKVYSLVFYTHKPGFEKRKHPFSSYFYEEIAGKFVNSELKVNYSFSTKKEAIGIWISSDGDDTNSSYNVLIKNIIIN